MLFPQSLGWNGRSLSPDTTSSSHPSRRQESLALPLSLSSTTPCSKTATGLGTTPSALVRPWRLSLHTECCLNSPSLFTIIKPCNSGRKTNWYLGPKWDRGNCIYRNESVSEKKLGQRKLLIEGTLGYNEACAEIAPVQPAQKHIH